MRKNNGQDITKRTMSRKGKARLLQTLAGKKHASGTTISILGDEQKCLTCPFINS
jgi:hypothetical protein